MATAKKTGIVSKVKDAITGMFSSDNTKRKPTARTTARKAVKTTAKKAAKAVKKAAKNVTAAAKKVASPAKKVSAKRSASAKRSKPGTSMDRKLISLSEPYEVRDWAKSMGCTEAELKAAVAAVGNSAAKVRQHLKR